MKLSRQPINTNMLKVIRDSLLAPVPPARSKRAEPVMRPSKVSSEQRDTPGRAPSE